MKKLLAALIASVGLQATEIPLNDFVIAPEESLPFDGASVEELTAQSLFATTFVRVWVVRGDSTNPFGGLTFIYAARTGVAMFIDGIDLPIDDIVRADVAYEIDEEHAGPFANRFEEDRVSFVWPQWWSAVWPEKRYTHRVIVRTNATSYHQDWAVVRLRGADDSYHYAWVDSLLPTP
jgi:hypothetical protein